ncbi:FCD domain-containing protein [Bosea sp. (in: a-proteobacteria)]|uniref:FCD domain-containing protein n=1 Tax=Bosea sp. (in: a-proteobacteria) TaxID=1871050 RepID=UPI002DDCAC36|nr:FCD domain-containing protein [Bosea sp. (in: a-proteobacteria)]HEV2508805.1 FCD domain-containing protein [Bosea sp. (in: a-proteobacteria)]
MRVKRNAAAMASHDETASPEASFTAAETAYRRLRSDIVAGVFEPGQPLRLEFLRQRYGLSFSPLREALNRLQTERLVLAAALRGFSVAPVSIEEMWDVTETRSLIECEALKRSIERGDDDWEAGIVAAFHALDLQVRRLAPIGRELSVDELSTLEIRHQEFHSALIARCGSRRLINLSDQLHVETQRYRLPALAGKMPTGTRDVALEHRQIMDATLARDADKAQALLAAHYRRTAELIEAQMSPRAN